MKRIPLREGWWLRDAGTREALDSAAIAAITGEQLCAGGGWIATGAPAVVQEVLFQAGLLDRGVLETGRAEPCAWVSERDWVYRCRFDRPATADDRTAVYIDFKGLDTVADIALNGDLVGQHRSMFLPARVDVTDRLRESNELLVYFHSPFKILRQIEASMPAAHRGLIPPGAYLRKAPGDFNSHGGAVPYFAPIGFFGDVELAVVEGAEILDVDVDIALNRDFSRAMVNVKVTCGDVDRSRALSTRVRLRDEQGEVAAEASAGFGGSLHLTVERPRLWWPKGCGPQPLYALEVAVEAAGAVLDRVERTMGFRDIQMTGDLAFCVNGKALRLWGSCITPMWGASHRWDRERTLTIIEHAERAHMNALRIWGPGQPYDDELYEEMDRRGILVWQDFPIGGANIPDTADHVAILMREAEHMVRRLKHHPSLLLWCGGNESIYMGDLFVGGDRIGHDLIHHGLRDLCGRLDPRRYYHANSPCGGAYANDASALDTHGSRASRSYLPGEEHATFFSENIRTFVPELRSLRRFIGAADLWPEGWTTLTTYGVTQPMPPAWMERTINHMEDKTGPLERFHDAQDPAGLVYRVNAAAAWDLRQIINRLRRGKPAGDSQAPRRTNGHLVWKLDTAWPQIYCAFVDYYLEVGLPYYAVRRAYAPVQISVDVQDHVYVWGVNDTQHDAAGDLTVTVLDLETEQVTHRLTVPAAVAAGEARILCDLDSLGQFRLASVLHACLRGADGRELASDTEYLRPERSLVFPDARLSLAVDDDGCLRVASDRFARCVELSGSDQGDDLGWYFEDNYFDLLPGEERSVGVYGKHESGVVAARPHFSTTTAQVPYRR